MKKIIILIGFILMLFACTKQDDNQSFDSFKENFIVSLWQIYPTWASGVGYHNFDSVLVIPNQQSRDKEIAFATKNLAQLKQFKLNQLSENNQTDFLLIENLLNQIIWQINEEKEFEWNPANYNVSEYFATMLSENYDSLNTRLQNIAIKLQNVPAYYQAAKQNITNPTVEHTNLAIEQNLGGLSVFTNDLKIALQNCTLSNTLKDTIYNRTNAAILAINNYVNWLKTNPNPNPKSFRLGKKLYAQKFNYSLQAENSAEEIYQQAVQHKTNLHQKMKNLAEQLWPKYMGNTPKPNTDLALIKMVIDTISVYHVHPDSFQVEIEKQIPQLVEFVNQKNLIFIDPKKPLVVRKEPAYMAGVAGASISAPGPYDKNGNTYYNVGSLNGWDKSKAESYLREYNHYILQILNIHEAIPGHYTQLVYSNQSPSIVKAVLGNGAMREGWAVYTELMMLENGYGNFSPELWLMYYKFNLRTTCNTILDIGVHTNNMTKEEALNMLTKEAFQQQAEAEGKWRRVTLTSVQLCSYFTGYSEIVALREALKAKQVDKFNLKNFHEKFLSYGSAPVKYIKNNMLNAKND